MTVINSIDIDIKDFYKKNHSKLTILFIIFGNEPYIDYKNFISKIMYIGDLLEFDSCVLVNSEEDENFLKFLPESRKFPSFSFCSRTGYHTFHTGDFNDKFIFEKIKFMLGEMRGDEMYSKIINNLAKYPKEEDFWLKYEEMKRDL